ncbi:MAG TPA: Smr/MutS family protein [Myxococcota bacterium]|nr:Smr/MutS family protein [Myxococcota bacterium]
MQVSRRTLESLEWPLVLERLRAHVQTPGGRMRCAVESDTALFTADAESARARLAETAEARALLELEAPPFGGLSDVGAALARAERGGEIGAGDLLDVAAAVSAIDATARWLARRAEGAPRLAALAASLGRHVSLADAVEAAIDPEGRLRDTASAALAEARAEARRLGGELQRLLDSALRDPEIAPHLSDSFVTLRNDRYVLPVRADARGRVRGIVHDASASGTTLFIEPQVAVDANNRLKQAELAIERETARILRELSAALQREAPALRASLEQLAEIDLAFARGALARDWNAVLPELRDAGVLRLPQLRHPLLPPDRAVPNDVHLGASHRVLVLSGPNAGGKTVAMKAVALAALCASAGLHVAAAPGARVDFLARVLADIGDAQSLRESLSTFSAHLANLARIVDAADEHALVVLDEIGDGTDPGEGAALAQAVLEALAGAGARVIATTHYGLLKEMAAVDPRFENASFEFDPATLAPTYRLRPGAPGASSATAVAARMGLRHDVLDRANELLDREDRRLERLLAELNTSRLALDQERAEAARARAETETERAELGRRLEELQRRRDRLYGEMRRDLESSFRRAHEEVASVIRTLQQGGGARAAARARDELRAIEERAPAQPELADDEGLASAARGGAVAPIDWREARAGARVSIAGGGVGVLLSLPDRRGRVGVQVGAARLVLPADRIGAAPEAVAPARTARVSIEAGDALRADDSAGTAARIDLRGLRVEEALARVSQALDRAAVERRAHLTIVHGLGTGALRAAVREHLAGSPYVLRYAAASLETGGEGATEVTLA